MHLPPGCLPRLFGIHDPQGAGRPCACVDAHACPNLLTTYEAVHQSDLDSESVGFTSDSPVSVFDFDVLRCAWPQFPTAQRRLPGTSFTLLPSNTTRSEGMPCPPLRALPIVASWLAIGKARRPSSYHTRTRAFSPPSSVPRDSPPSIERGVR